MRHLEEVFPYFFAGLERGASTLITRQEMCSITSGGEEGWNTLGEVFPLLFARCKFNASTWITKQEGLDPARW